MELRGKKTLVVGLGRTGRAVSRFLAMKGAVVTAADARAEGELIDLGGLAALGVDIKAGGHETVLLDGMDLMVVSPGVSLGIPLVREAKKRGLNVISEIELASRFIKEPMAAVTGTNGKTTTATLLARIFENHGKKVFLGGNIGTPLIEYVEKAERADIIVVEVSSFQLEAIEDFRPKAAILLNIAEDHLYRHKGMDDYAQAKMRLFLNQTGDDFAVINMTDPVIQVVIRRCMPRSRLVSIGSRDMGGITREQGRMVLRLDSKDEDYPTKGFRLLGQEAGVHNADNIMAVIATARIMGVGRSTIINAIEAFHGLPHRMELVREVSGVRYINDSKSTNIASLLNALQGLSGPVVLIAGGVDKGGDYGVLRTAVKGKVKLLILIGEACFKLKDQLSDVVETLIAPSLEDAVRLAEREATSGDTVLLSPACSSFDMFANFEDRGERFRKAVLSL
ncbi:MAG: UDP-N-acetylmuramoyl-L-alanine--D-glutamate ligase [Deltaproteobacteria bacterium]|nr:UDP-N-acetylmuramoyl-L-alanine--D-glutamate ligase [Deltaproteobacteria bacterium]